MTAPKTVTVWHANDPTWSGDPAPEWDSDNYTMVAIIAPFANGEAVNLDYAYERTNHVHQSWWEHEEVTLVGPEARSTSVGDVIFREGVAYRVARIGYDAIKKKVA